MIGGLLFNAGTLKAQTWTLLPQNPLGSTGTMLLLSNGNVMVQGGGVSAEWSILAPDKNGNYAPTASTPGGTWTQTSNMNTARFNYASWVLPNGNLLVAGGQYEFVSGAISDLELYNPTTGLWTQSQSLYPGLEISNAPSLLLPSGSILFGDVSSANTYQYSPPPSDTWNTSGQTVFAPLTLSSPVYTSAGQGYTLLPGGGSVLTWPLQSNVGSNAYLGPNWARLTGYHVGDIVANNSNFYMCVNAYNVPPANGGQMQSTGVSNATGNGPSGNGFNIADGNLDYVTNAQPPELQDYVLWSVLVPWQPLTSYSVGQAVYFNGIAYFCIQAGVSGPGGGPNALGVGAGINYIDGSVVWSYQSSNPKPPPLGSGFNPPVGQLYSIFNQNWAQTPLANVQVLGTSYTDATGAYVIGPASVMPDGSVVQFGANNNTMIYSNSQWSIGPTFPAGVGADAAPGAMMPNGQFLIAVDSAPGQGAPTRLYTYSYLTKALTSLTLPTGNPSIGTDMKNAPAKNRRMLVLPNGHILLNTSTGNIWDYAPGGAAPLSSWQPTIANVMPNTSTSYTLSGTRLTGISTGAVYGANATSATNYPVVQLTNTATGIVKYALTTGWTPNVSAAGDSTPQQCIFQMPSGFGVGTYQLVVIANGIPSSPYNFVVAAPQPNYVSMTYNPSTQAIGITGDNDNNALTIALKNQILTVSGNNLTQINTTQTATWNTGSTAVTLTVSNPLIAVGMEVIGTGIPVNTTVAAVSGTSLTLSQKATGAGIGGTLSFELIAATQKASWANGANTVTLSGSNSAIASGMAVFGAGIPANTYVTSVSGTTVAISNNATAAGSGIVLSFGGQSLAIHFGTNLNLATSLSITGALNSGNDYVVVNGLSAKNLTLTLAAGNDTCTVTYSTIGTVNVNGGTGLNTFGQAASKITGLVLSSITNTSN